MSVHLKYFNFSTLDWTQGAISFESYHLKGLFIDICALYWNRIDKGPLTLDKLYNRFPGQDLQQDIDYLISLDIIELSEDRVVNIKFLDQYYENIKAKRDAGRKGGIKKAETEAKEKAKIKADAKVRHEFDGVTVVKTVDGKTVTTEEFMELVKWYGEFNDTRKLAFELLAEKQGRAKPNIKGLKFDRKAVTGAIRLIRDGVTQDEYGQVVAAITEDSFHIENNYKYLTPEYTTRDQIYSKWAGSIELAA